MHWCYVVYSPTLDKFYIGETENLELRITQHNTAFFKSSYTSKASDWMLYASLVCKDRAQARKAESFTKRMKRKKFIINLKNSIELQNDILNRFIS